MLSFLRRQSDTFGVRRRLGSQSGVALVIVLSLVLIVSLLLVAFVTAMQMDRVASSSYGQSLAAEQIGLGALNRVVEELRSEMSVDASPNYAAGGIFPVYTNVSSANITPQRFATNGSMPALVRVSGPISFTNIAGASVGKLIASTNGTFQPSQNKRYLDISRWGAPYLGDFPSDASLPKWIMLTRSGTASVGTFGASGATFNNPEAANTNYVVGRFAYAIYNVGGLLDVTAAGYPSSLTLAQVNQIKRGVAGADLTAVGIGSGNADALVEWRNAKSSATAASYLDYATNYAGTNGFLRVFPGDTTFLSRQDLISAAKAGPVAGLDTNDLLNLTVFSREKNAPSWGPSTNAPVAGFDYATQANTAAAANRFAPMVRFPTAATIKSYHGDGSEFTYEVKAGDSLIQRRFFLDRLKWLGPNGPQNGGTTLNIQACFGLRWNDAEGVWTYVGKSGSTPQSVIKTLEQVASELREPDFFELLRAGILSGSLGLSGTPSVTNGTGAVADAPTLHQESTMLQVMRIGAAIIDQYDSDSYPTVIEYSDTTRAPATIWQAVGTEDLPYLNNFRALVGTSPNTPAATPSALAIYLTVGLWNPHQTVPLPQPRPNLRVRMSGLVGVANGYGAGSVAVSPGLRGYIAEIPAGGATIPLSASGVDGFHDPQLLTAATAGSPGSGTGAGLAWAETPPINPYPTDRTKAIAYRLPDLELDLTKPAVSTPDYFAYNSVYFRFMPDANLEKRFQITLEYQTPSGGWMPYSRLNGINDPRTWLAATSPFYVWFGRRGGTPSEILDSARFDAQFDNYGSVRLTTIPAGSDPAHPETPALSYWVNPIRMAIDPRSLRFTWFYSGGSGALPQISRGGYKPFWAAAMPDSGYQSTGYGFDRSKTSNGQEFVPPLISATNPSYFPARLTRNNSDNAGTFSSYLDRDGVRRIGDSGMYPSSTNWLTGNPHGRVADRPIVLNRPFQSVAELGYVLRDDPWRTLDFFSSNSADAALLDLFALNETQVEKSAGKIDLNTRNPKVIEAVLRGAITDVVTPGIPLSDPAAIAANLVSLTSTNALVDKSDLVTKFIGNTTVLSGTSDESLIKSRREAIARALSDVGQTRTWNLMIDLVAQSGKYPPAADALDQFVVEGERRYWLHVAIDRFTGEIIEKQLEQVIE